MPKLINQASFVACKSQDVQTFLSFSALFWLYSLTFHHRLWLSVLFQHTWYKHARTECMTWASKSLTLSSFMRKITSVTTCLLPPCNFLRFKRNNSKNKDTSPTLMHLAIWSSRISFCLETILGQMTSAKVKILRWEQRKLFKLVGLKPKPQTNESSELG